MDRFWFIHENMRSHLQERNHQRVQYLFFSRGDDFPPKFPNHLKTTTVFDVYGFLVSPHEKKRRPFSLFFAYMIIDGRRVWSAVNLTVMLTARAAGLRHPIS
jgi:hypothetical protein